MTAIPHFAAPFKLTAQGVTVDEQDSINELQSCVQNIVSCPLGFRIDLPAFGVPDPTFGPVPVDGDAIEQAVTRWEPRAAVQILERGDATNPANRQVEIHVQARA